MSLTKIAGSGSESGSISQRHGYADLDPHQNVLDPEHWSKIRFLTREKSSETMGFRVQDLQRVTCEKLELASHVTGLEEEVERSREELHHTRDQLDRLQQAGTRSF
jgi:hypothetical protein